MDDGSHAKESLTNFGIETHYPPSRPGHSRLVASTLSLEGTAAQGSKEYVAASSFMRERVSVLGLNTRSRARENDSPPQVFDLCATTKKR